MCVGVYTYVYTYVGSIYIHIYIYRRNNLKICLQLVIIIKYNLRGFKVSEIKKE